MCQLRQCPLRACTPLYQTRRLQLHQRQQSIMQRTLPANIAEKEKTKPKAKPKAKPKGRPKKKLVPTKAKTKANANRCVAIGRAADDVVKHRRRNISEKDPSFNYLSWDGVTPSL